MHGKMFSSRRNAASPNKKCHSQADELTAHSDKRMKELEKEIQDCERAMVSPVNDQ